MNDKQAVDWQGRAARWFCLGVILLGIFFLFRVVLSLVLPFLLAFLLSAAIRPGAVALSNKWRVPRRLASIVLLLLLLLVLGMLISLGSRRLLLEAQRLMAYVSNEADSIGHVVAEIVDFITRITSHVPFLAELKQSAALTDFWLAVDEKVAQLVLDALTRISGQIPGAIATLLRSIPMLLLFLFTFLLSAFYCCADDGSITRALLNLLPQSWRQRWEQSRPRVRRVAVRYLRAYLLLFALTFLQLLIGFSLLRLPYVFMPALLIAAVDFLPVLGVGTVLVPWAAVELLRGNYGLGTGLLVLFGIMLLLRQLAEPRIIGESLGLHPLAALFAVYVGLRLFGFWGVLIAPAAALLIKSLLLDERVTA